MSEVEPMSGKEGEPEVSQNKENYVSIRKDYPTVESGLLGGNEVHVSGGWRYQEYRENIEKRHRCRGCLNSVLDLLSWRLEQNIYMEIS